VNGDATSVDPRSVAAAAVLQNEGVIVLPKLGMEARGSPPVEDHDVLIAATERHRLSAQQRKPLPLEGALNPDNRALQHRSPRLELDGTENLKRNPAASQPEVQSGAPIATAATVSGVLAAPKRLRCPPASLVACGIIATGAVDSSPAVANGLVYVGSDDGHLNSFSSPGGMTSMAQRPPSPSRLRPNLSLRLSA